MSTRIRLHISQRPAQDDPSVIITRLICRVAFYQGEGKFGPDWYGLLDTGAPTSLIPWRMWQDCPIFKLKDYAIRGLVDRPECALEVIDGVISCVLRDDEATSKELVIRAHLAPSDEVPLLLGFSGLLNRARLCVSIEKGEAYLDI